MNSAFNFKLNHAVQAGLVCTGKFDGKHHSLAFATSTGNVLIHNPYRTDLNSDSSRNTDVQTLAINRKITALSSGCLGLPSSGERDSLLVGTETNLMAYDVDRNSDLFYKDVPDGVHSLIFGRVPNLPGPISLVGGNCSIQGFDSRGSECYWTVTGDDVTALALCDVDSDGRTELVVGSADNEIRVFRGEESIGEITESDAVSSLTSIRDSSFGFALSNGAIGSYQKMKKAWSTKSKAVPVALASFDLDGDGVNELITAWDNGKIEARSDKDGSLVFSDKLRAPAAGLAVADYRSDGKQQVIAVSTDGEVRGYSTAADEFARAAIETGIRDKTLQELTAQKLELQAELKSFDSNRAAIRGGKQNAGVIPPNTECKIQFEASLSQGGLVMVLNATNDTVIKLVTVFADNLFDGESFVLHPKPTELSSTVRIPLRISRDVQIDMSVQVMVGYRSSLQDHVFESTHRLPKFASFELLQPRDVREPASGVTCQFADRISNVTAWMNENFSATIDTKVDKVDTHFRSLRNPATLLSIKVSNSSQSVQIKTNDMDLAGSIVQDLSAYLGISDLATVADFPEELDSFRQVLTRVDEFHRIRTRLSAEIADSSNIVKAMVIKAEDARLLAHMPTMRRAYNELHALNRELIGEYAKRANNHNQLLEALKDVNQMIQKAAKLRMGKHKTEVVTACRAAIQSNNIAALFKIIQSGRAG